MSYLRRSHQASRDQRPPVTSGARFPLPARLPLHLAIAGLLLLGVLPLASGAAGQQASTSSSIATAGKVTISVENGAQLNAAALAKQLGPTLTTIWGEFSAIFATQPTHTVTLALVPAPSSATVAGMLPIDSGAWADATGQLVLIQSDTWQTRTPAQVAELLRNALSRGFMQSAAKGRMPVGLMQGTALFTERPLLPEQSRLGSVVRTAAQSPGIPAWPVLLPDQPPATDQATAAAESYAVVSFLVDRYGINSFQQFIQTIGATGGDWQAAMAKAFGEPAAQIESRWRDGLTQWYTTGWRINVLTGFDLSPAQGLFDRGAYTAAKGYLQPSQQLFSQLGDKERLSKVEALLAQCDVGIQTEQVMGNVKSALDGHDYARASQLLDQAEQLYALLPKDQRPASLLSTYHALADRGLRATKTLGKAQSQSGNWGKTRETRRLALTAGESFSTLGDADRTQAARKLASQMDVRQHRVTLSLGGLGTLLLFWLALWLWARSPQKTRW